MTNDSMLVYRNECIAALSSVDLDSVKSVPEGIAEATTEWFTYLGDKT